MIQQLLTWQTQSILEVKKKIEMKRFEQPKESAVLTSTLAYRGEADAGPGGPVGTMRMLHVKRAAATQRQWISAS